MQCTTARLQGAADSQRSCALGGGQSCGSCEWAPRIWKCLCRVAGTWVGYLSSVLYLSSRMSQIHKNWSRRSAEGLAYAMFICSISANCLYGLGILIRTYHTSQLWSSLPWLIGSLGTVSLDVIILSQVSHCSRPCDRL